LYVQCIAPFGGHTVGDITEIPDGSEVSEFWFAPCNADGSPLAAATDPTTPAGDGSDFPPAA
jgi:hypothetical protein